MSGLLRRLTRGRAATADEPRSTASEASEPAAAPPETPAEPGGRPPVPEVGAGAPSPAAAASEQPTELIPATGERQAVADGPATASGPADAAPAVADGSAAPPDAAPARDLPAGIDPGELELAPAPSARRGRLRRRLRYLRRVRELLLRDLGGFTYEVHRTAGAAPRESHRRLAEAKTGRLAAVDAEVLELERRLGEPHAEPVLREPGVGGACPECGELHASDAHYCARCGAPLDKKARAAREAALRAAAQPTTTSHPTPEPKPASVLWAAGPRPQARAASGDEAAQPRTSQATSEWLTTGSAPAPADAPRPAAGEQASAEAAAEEPKPAAAEPASAEAAAEEPKPAAGDADVVPEPEEKPKARRRAKRSTVEPAPGEKPPGPNGRRDEDVPPPVRSGDPLGSPGERHE